jgi:hypothetical protein
LIELFRVLLKKCDRTVIDLGDKKGAGSGNGGGSGGGATRLANKIMLKGNGEQAKMIDFEDLDAEILQNYLHRILTFLITLTSQAYPYMLLNASIHQAMHTACAHLLSLSELKAQKLTGSLDLILDLTKNLILTAKINSQTTSANELLNVLAQKRHKMMQFFADGCRDTVINKLN